MMLSLRAVLHIYVDHMRLRALHGNIEDPAALEMAANELRKIAWEAERRHARKKQ